MQETGTRSSPRGSSTGASVKRHESLISETLTWCCDLFGTTRARLVRPMDGGRWVVYTLQHDSLIMHAADYAEIAMAYTVGLGRQPLVVTKPRVAHADGTNLRPIALTGYLGIPMICQDRLIGVIELSSEIRPDIEMALSTAIPQLQATSERMVFDPHLHRHAQITRDSTIELNSAVWTAGTVTLAEDDMRFLSTIDGPTILTDAARLAGMDDDRAVELATSLAARGLVAAQNF